jgi:hypothetical protein
MENSGGLGKYLAGRLAAAGEESVVDVPPKLSARMGVLSRASLATQYRPLAQEWSE